MQPQTLSILFKETNNLLANKRQFKASHVKRTCCSKEAFSYASRLAMLQTHAELDWVVILSKTSLVNTLLSSFLGVLLKLPLVFDLRVWNDYPQWFSCTLPANPNTRPLTATQYKTVPVKSPAPRCRVSSSQRVTEKPEFLG